MYDDIARYYDLNHDRLIEDIPFLLGMAGEAGGPALEIGCGSGRLLVPLARNGYVVTGVDNSREMLGRAADRLAAEPEHVRDRIRLVAADVRSLTLPADAAFGLIFFGYNTFMHLDETAAATAMQRLRPLLRTGGRLYIDVDNPLMLAASADDPDFVLEDIVKDPATGEAIRQYTAYEAIPGEQALEVTWAYEPVGDPTAYAEVRLRYHYLYPHQYELLLALTGFRLLGLFGDYQGRPFSEESERLLVVATTA